MSNNLPKQAPGGNNDKDLNAYFSGFYNKSVSVSGAVHDVVLTFFLGRTDGNRDAAKALTASVLVLAMNKGIDPLSLIEQFKTYASNESFKAALIGLLNSDRRSTSKLGYSSVATPNQYVVRNISN